MEPLLLQAATEGGGNSASPALVIAFVIVFALACGMGVWIIEGSSSTKSKRQKQPKEQFCNDCGLGMDGTRDFCPRCGYPTDSGMDDKRLCTNCSTINDVEANFCGGCGDSI